MIIITKVFISQHQESGKAWLSPKDLNVAIGETLSIDKDSVGGANLEKSNGWICTDHLAVINSRE